MLVTQHLPPRHADVARAVAHPPARPDRRHADVAGRRRSPSRRCSACRWPGWSAPTRSPAGACSVGRLVLPLAMPGYILGFVTGVGVRRRRSDPDVVARPVRPRRVVPGDPLDAVRDPDVVAHALPVRVPDGRAPRLRDQAATAATGRRTLGASRAEATRRVVIPLLRPAIAAGAAVVAMETLTDFGTVQYFNVETVTVGLFRIWRGTYDRDAASQIAALVLLFALLAIGAERVLRGRARYGESGGQGAGVEPTSAAWADGRRRAPSLPARSCVIAFLAPVTAARQVGDRRADRTARAPRWSTSTRGSCATASCSPRRRPSCASIVAALITNARRFGNRRLVGSANRLSAVGYAVPGPVVGMGVVVALVALDDRLESIGLGPAGGDRDRIVPRPRLRLRGAVPGAGDGVGRSRARAGVRRDDRSARTLGASPMRVLGRIHLPLSRASVLTAGAARRRRRPQGAAARLPAAAGRVRHAAGLGVQPRVGVTLPAGCVAGADDHRRRDDPSARAQPPTRPTTTVNESAPLRRRATRSRCPASPSRSDRRAP